MSTEYGEYGHTEYDDGIEYFDGPTAKHVENTPIPATPPELLDEEMATLLVEIERVARSIRSTVETLLDTGTL